MKGDHNMKKSKYEINSMSFDIEKNGDIKVNVNFDTKNFKNILALVHLSRFDNKYEAEYSVSRHDKLNANGSYYKLETDNIYGSIISALDQIISKADAKLADAFGLNMNFHKFAQSISFERKVEYVVDEDFNPSELSCIMHAKKGNYGYCFWVKAKKHRQYQDDKYTINVELSDQSNTKFLGKQIMMTKYQFSNVDTCMKILKQYITEPLYWELCVKYLEKRNHVKVRKYKLHWK